MLVKVGREYCGQHMVAADRGKEVGHANQI